MAIATFSMGPLALGIVNVLVSLSAFLFRCNLGAATTSEMRWACHVMADAQPSCSPGLRLPICPWLLFARMILGAATAFRTAARCPQGHSRDPRLKRYHYL